MTTSTLTLADFLLARIAEDEGHARMVLDRTGEWNAPPISPERVLAECEAKRRIVEIHGANEPYHVDPCDAHDPITLKSEPCDTLHALALPYADHPNYREEWKP